MTFAMQYFQAFCGHIRNNIFQPSQPLLMKKLLILCFPALLLSGCFKPNSTTPITSVEQKMNGSWQVDSTITISYDSWRTDPVTGYYQSYRTAADSIYKNHLINISSSGSTVTINMASNDIMRYTISDSLLTPYILNSNLPSFNFSGGGCGMPLVQNNSVHVTDHQLIISSYQMNSSIGTDTSITYMHR
jgi:hypothetical protein